MTQNFQIAIDGPASSGKSTLAKRLAQHYGYIYLDTGAMYRCLSLAASRAGIGPEDEEGLKKLLAGIEISFQASEQGQLVYLNGEEVTRAIREDQVSNLVSYYAAIPLVRQELVKRQQEIARRAEGIVMDGRDIGTVVLPQAQVKIYLIASVHERAKRRYLENQDHQYSDQSLEEIEEEIRQRDHYDMNREESPLRPAPDAVHVDSSELTIEEVQDRLITIIDEKKREKAENI
ncbi:(d)CMP kinase [Aerococcus sanguinicola]|uniref:Cytidylate kinase n=1 Tax=Aerococcus sanguinicola TaxID=119206 RepID=A0A0X8FD33_9LACT|nr:MULTISPECIES: (d)CMP kinase [Aerococcus]AMB94924.1 cytidylate kinase [Aerococcus sanguinicola]MDK7051025.1 (d)CMP kinase [Aerococcus sanguinicola]OFT94497.1 cytidylate kinase [Aerococcus sp. HMSC23C02]PKZ20521.1 (d)CMP kinase [Aerococcus sanguinicola]